MATDHYALTFELNADRIQAIYIVCNPDKLRHLATGTESNHTNEHELKIPEI